jgi:hypothetical protein
MPPTLPDVREVDQAILAVLTGDAILAALMPGGVHWDVAPPGLTAFVTVTSQDFSASYVFGPNDGGIERIGYQVVAISRGSSSDAPLDAAARIHDLLQRQTLPLTGTGYELMSIHRSRRIRFSEFDRTNAEWQHIGAIYDVFVSSETPVIN